MKHPSLRKLLSRTRNITGQESSDCTDCTPQTTPESSSASASDGDELKPRSHATAVPQPEHQKPSPTTLALQPDSSAEKRPSHAISHAGASRLPGQLWTQAYEAVRKDNARLVDGFETLVRHVLGELDPADNPPDGENCQADETREQMVRLVEAGLRKTEREAAAKNKIEEGMRVVSSVRDLVGTALKHAPEAATAWGGMCLLLRVSCYF